MYMINYIVSVIIPIYNVEEYLNRCIESIVNQTYCNVEIILVDDGSPDNCPRICDEWAKKDNRIIVIHKQNGGLSDARNAGIDVASGELITFIDSDDWVESNYIEEMVSHISDTVDIVSCAARLCDEKNNTLKIRGAEEAMLFDNTNAVKSVLLDSDVGVIACAKLFKKSVISGIYFEKGRYHEDTFWTWKVVNNAQTVFVSDLPLYNYFQRSDSIMGTGYSLKRLDALDSAYEKYLFFKDDERFSATVKKLIVSTCLFNLQSAMKYLEGNDYTVAKKRIKATLNNVCISPFDKDLNRLWYKLFLICPFITARIRSITGIGF